MKIYVRVDDALYAQLHIRAESANLKVSEFVRPLLEEAAFPGGRYVFTGNDELLGIAIQTFALLASMAAEQSPALLEKGTERARELLGERGLLNGQDGQ